jgi:hypothetical protein
MFYRFIIIATIFSVYACGTKTNTSPASDLANQLKSGQWMVHYFFDNNTDLTRQYSTVQLTFNNNNTLSISNGNEAFNGGWSVTKDNDGTERLLINIASLSTIQLLNNNWKVISVTSGTFVQLKDPDSNSTKELHIMKM